MSTNTERPSLAQHIVDQAEAERRREAREHILTAARQGKSPAQLHRQRDIARIYEGCEHELQEAISTANAARAARAEQEQAREQAAELRRETRAVVREWDKQAEAERWAKAEAEARRRLGLEEPK